MGTVSGCGGKGDKDDAANPPASATPGANNSAPAGGGAAVADVPPKVTPFTKGEANFTYDGKPTKMKLSQGKLVESPSEQYSEIESIYLEYSPSGKVTGEGGLSFNAGKTKTRAYNVDDMRITRPGFWRISGAAHCSIVVSEVGAAGVRGTITCPGDPKGPSGPINFSATP
jgi:hypothetical protein